MKKYIVPAVKVVNLNPKHFIMGSNFVEEAERKDGNVNTGFDGGTIDDGGWGE